MLERSGRAHTAACRARARARRGQAGAEPHSRRAQGAPGKRGQPAGAGVPSRQAAAQAWDTHVHTPGGAPLPIPWGRRRAAWSTWRRNAAQRAAVSRAWRDCQVICEGSPWLARQKQLCKGMQSGGPWENPGAFQGKHNQDATARGPTNVHARGVRGAVIFAY